MASRLRPEYFWWCANTCELTRPWLKSVSCHVSVDVHYCLIPLYKLLYTTLHSTAWWLQGGGRPGPGGRRSVVSSAAVQCADCRGAGHIHTRGRAVDNIYTDIYTDIYTVTRKWEQNRCDDGEGEWGSQWGRAVIRFIGWCGGYVQIIRQHCEQHLWCWHTDNRYIYVIVPPHNNWAVDMIESLLRKGAVSADCDCKKWLHKLQRHMNEVYSSVATAAACFRNTHSIVRWHPGPDHHLSVFNFVEIQS